ncbi:S-methyl-5-thioribose-1-phosphate isomerase [Nowakowskiella sp. JEL0407]|nr:S-methyl-5-thioribose-1-phosphate isomerase [Nowakowskiella sp. JEL0407]
MKTSKKNSDKSKPAAKGVSDKNVRNVGPFQLAVEVLDKLKKKQGTIKSLILSDKSAVPAKDKKRVYGIVCETLKCMCFIGNAAHCGITLLVDKAATEIIIKNAGGIKSEKKLSHSLITVLVVDLLFGSGGLHGANPVAKEAILKHKTRLNAELVKYKIKNKFKSNDDLIAPDVRDAISLPRYVRVNTLKTTTVNVLNQFAKEGFKIEEPTSNLQHLPPKTVRQDFHFPDIIVLPDNTDLHDHILTKNGEIILQDKASCFPPFALNPPENSVVIDACAAPGNKTSGLSAIMKNTGKIFAFDRDRVRLGTLQKLCNRAGCTNIEPICTSFLDENPEDSKYKDVEYILLDPSCSGSGITRRLDHLQAIAEEEQDNEEQEGDRIDSLAEFQLTALLHAFSFPNVKRVVYSTCSIHRQENEDVVMKALSSQKEFVLANKPLRQWTRRGMEVFEGSTNLIRTIPSEDRVLNQLLLPFETVYEEVKTVAEGHTQIKTMKVRGAPAIAIVAALSLAVDLFIHTSHSSVQPFSTASDAVNYIHEKLEYLKTSRPTAVNLFDAAHKLGKLVENVASTTSAKGADAADAVVKAYLIAAEKMLEDDISDNKNIGKYGAEFILKNAPESHKPNKIRILTHCNTGSLATAGWGTALGVVRQLFADGNIDHVFCTETRPYNQGSRLTAYELVFEKIPSTLITDSMASALLRDKGITAIIVGADRVAANGDTANKIGTYQLAIAAKFHGVQFIVAAPTTSIDLNIESGKQIPIEERAAIEVMNIRGQVVDDEAGLKEPGSSKHSATVKIAAPGIGVWNPAFDVTPAELITGIATEKGVMVKEPGQKEFNLRAALK